MRPLSLALALLFAVAGTASAQTAVWLDAPPRGWNTPGASVPAPAQASRVNTDRCTAQERTPAGAEESAVGAAGWRLTTYWPSVRAGDVAVVVATAGYDGMCRPIGYQAFVFAGGRYAGTLSPEPMASRTDGALATTPESPGVTVSGDGVDVRFIRYRASDPLCCPTGGLTRVTYAIQRAAGGPLVVATAVANEPAAMPAPTQLPRTGGVALVALAAFAALLTLLGAALRPLGYVPPFLVGSRTANRRSLRSRRAQKEVLDRVG